MLNTSGGVAGGDRLATGRSIAGGARARSPARRRNGSIARWPGEATRHAANRLPCAAGACRSGCRRRAILFDRCVLDRRLEIELADGCRVPWRGVAGVRPRRHGRAMCGSAGAARTIRVRRDGVLLLHDAVRHEWRGQPRHCARAAVAGGARAVATLVHVAPDARSGWRRCARRWRAVEAGASAWRMACWWRVSWPPMAPRCAARRRGACSAAGRARVAAGLDVLRSRR